MSRRRKNNNDNRKGQRTFALWAIIILMVMTLMHFINQPITSSEKVTFSELLTALGNNQVESILIQDDQYSGKFKTSYQNGARFETVGPANSEQMLTKLAATDAKVEYQKKMETPFWQHLLISWLPMLLLFGLFFFSMRQIQVGGGKAMSFGRSKARLLQDTQKHVTFKDVAGVEEAKEELEEIIEFLRDPKKFTKLGGRIPKGVLLMGSPGTGKTLLARAVAGEAKVPFFSISGSDFVEMFVGVGASRVRDLFEQGKKNAPCIIFIDEIDAVGRHRGAGIGGGHDEREQTLNQLLVEMDGFESNEGVIIMAATNRPDVLDPALLRPGRFDRRVVVARPDVKGREEILRVHSRNKPMDPAVDLTVIARGTPGFSGADLESVVNEAALLAARHNRSTILMSDFELAKDKVLMGTERRSMMISEEEKKNTAFHEAGHTLVAKLIPGTDPIHKVTIIPRGMALGVTQQLPTDDRYTQNRRFCENSIAILMGGRAAEEIVFDQPTTGAGNDIERATELARRMVCEWGMSEKMGPLAFGKKDEQIFLGKELSTHKDYSDATAEQIDSEIRSIVQTGHARAKDLIQQHREQLDRLALALLEFESLDGIQIEQIMKGEKVTFLPGAAAPLKSKTHKEVVQSPIEPSEASIPLPEKA
ncbi:MAG: ATP-dependent metallopeptidase FtsH/Yme1/Tma family protein [Deltaproteobacteria bacterium]|nr:ATP-dependent metallopeptidase FtsH/Yme1/Tma family protein [Deltaproteobacteria bacterium]